MVCFGRILLKKSGTKTPQIELDEVGPSMNLKLRRIKIASEEMYRLARKVPKEAKVCEINHDCYLFMFCSFIIIYFIMSYMYL